MPTIHASLKEGYPRDPKARLAGRPSGAAVAAIGVDPAVVRVFVQDLPDADFGLGGQTAAALGRGISRAALVSHT